MEPTEIRDLKHVLEAPPSETVKINWKDILVMSISSLAVVFIIGMVARLWWELIVAGWTLMGRLAS